MRSVGASYEEAASPMVEHDGALALERFAFSLEVCQVDHVLVAGLELSDNFRSALIATTLVQHGVQDEDATRYGLTLVAREPVREHGVGRVVTHLRQNSDWHTSSSDVCHKVGMLELDGVVKFLAVLVELGAHELVVGECVLVGAELGRLHGVDGLSESNALVVGVVVNGSRLGLFLHEVVDLGGRSEGGSGGMLKSRLAVVPIMI